MLEDIGFYTLSDNRARNANEKSSLSRCEIVLLNACNFKCSYCRGIVGAYHGQMPLERVKWLIDYFSQEGLKNIRVSGGEPTLYPALLEVVRHAQHKGMRRIAISTNGSAKFSLYKDLIDAGVNDFSISLDACCAKDVDRLTGTKLKVFKRLVENIRGLSALSYVTVGIVLINENVTQLSETVQFASELGVADIRIISSAQYNRELKSCISIQEQILKKHPILSYRVENIKKGQHVRGLSDMDFRRCPLVLDDIAVVGEHHFPCIIYLREQGKPIGMISDSMRHERKTWFERTNTFDDPICRKNCLDVCIDYNNKWLRFDCENACIPKKDPSLFDWQTWRSGHDFLLSIGLQSRFQSLTSETGKELLRKYAIGWCYGDELLCRPKENEIAVLYFKDDEQSWFHLRMNEFWEIFVGP